MGKCTNISAFREIPISKWSTQIPQADLPEDTSTEIIPTESRVKQWLINYQATTF